MGEGSDGEEVDLSRLIGGLETIIHQLPTALVVMEAETLRIVLQSERVSSIWKVSRTHIRDAAHDDDLPWKAYFPDGRRYQRDEWS